MICCVFIHIIYCRPPSNSDILGSQLLGYRVYIRDLACAPAPAPAPELESSCVETKTISDSATTSARIGYLSE